MPVSAKWWIRAKLGAVRAAWQRATIGYAYEEAWNLNDYLARYALPRVRHLRDNNCGHPVDMTMEEWQAVLGNIVYSLELYVADAFGGVEDMLTYEVSQEPRYRAGLRLFGEHWQKLWD